MREALQARSARLPLAAPRPSLRSWLALAIQRRRQARQERLEWIERLAREQRRARRPAEFARDLQHQRRWQ